MKLVLGMNIFQFYFLFYWLMNPLKHAILLTDLAWVNLGLDFAVLQSHFRADGENAPFNLKVSR